MEEKTSKKTEMMKFLSILHKKLSIGKLNDTDGLQALKKIAKILQQESGDQFTLLSAYVEKEYSVLALLARDKISQHENMLFYFAKSENDVISQTPELLQASGDIASSSSTTSEPSYQAVVQYLKAVCSLSIEDSNEEEESSLISSGSYNFELSEEEREMAKTLLKHPIITSPFSKDNLVLTQDEVNHNKNSQPLSSSFIEETQGVFKLKNKISQDKITRTVFTLSKNLSHVPQENHASVQSKESSKQAKEKKLNQSFSNSNSCNNCYQKDTILKMKNLSLKHGDSNEGHTSTQIKSFKGTQTPFMNKPSFYVSQSSSQYSKHANKPANDILSLGAPKTFISSARETTTTNPRREYLVESAPRNHGYNYYNNSGSSQYMHEQYSQRYQGRGYYSPSQRWTGREAERWTSRDVGNHQSHRSFGPRNATRCPDYHTSPPDAAGFPSYQHRFSNHSHRGGLQGQIELTCRPQQRWSPRDGNYHVTYEPVSWKPGVRFLQDNAAISRRW